MKQEGQNRHPLHELAVSLARLAVCLELDDERIREDLWIVLGSCPA